MWGVLRMLSKSTVTGKHFWRGMEILETEYLNILSVIENKPSAPEGYGYLLSDALEWELYQLPVEDDDPEISEAEALGIILGGAV